MATSKLSAQQTLQARVALVSFRMNMLKDISTWIHFHTTDYKIRTVDHGLIHDLGAPLKEWLIIFGCATFMFIHLSFPTAFFFKFSNHLTTWSSLSFGRVFSIPITTLEDLYGTGTWFYDFVVETFLPLHIPVEGQRTYLRAQNWSLLYSDHFHVQNSIKSIYFRLSVSTRCGEFD